MAISAVGAGLTVGAVVGAADARPVGAALVIDDVVGADEPAAAVGDADPMAVGEGLVVGAGD